jgi:hypothetical protein
MRHLNVPTEARRFVTRTAGAVQVCRVFPSHARHFRWAIGKAGERWLNADIPRKSKKCINAMPPCGDGENPRHSVHHLCCTRVRDSALDPKPNFYLQLISAKGIVQAWILKMMRASFFRWRLKKHLSASRKRKQGIGASNRG